jgi:hypothetical protein
VGRVTDPGSGRALIEVSFSGVRGEEGAQLWFSRTISANVSKNLLCVGMPVASIVGSDSGSSLLLADARNVLVH